MKNLSLVLLFFLVFVSFACLAQQDTVKEGNHKKDWTISLSLGNAGINQSVFNLLINAGAQVFFYDQFSTDYLEIQKYSYAFGITKEFNKINVDMNFEKGFLERTATLYHLTDLGYGEDKTNEEYFLTSASISKKIPLGKLIIKTGLSVPLLFSNGATYHNYTFQKDSMLNIISESTVDYEFPNLFSYGIGIVTEFEYPLSQTISLGSCFSYYFLVTEQSGYKTGTLVSFPLYNVVTLNTMHHKTKSVSFSGIDLKIKLLINLKNILK